MHLNDLEHQALPGSENSLYQGVHAHPWVSVCLTKAWQTRCSFSEAPGVNRSTQSHVVVPLTSTEHTWCFIG